MPVVRSSRAATSSPASIGAVGAGIPLIELDVRRTGGGVLVSTTGVHRAS
jgi:hypothetical protein